jgi:phosphate transport system substrate-binding protein
MAENGPFSGRLFWLAGGLVALVSLAALAWIWRGGGIVLDGAGPARAAATETCDAHITAGSAYFPNLAQGLAESFLRTNGYDVAAPTAPTADSIAIVGLRESVQCTITLRAATSTQAFTDLGAGSADIALSMRPITDRDQAMLAGAGAGDFVRERALAEHLLAYDAVAIVAHSANTANEITVDLVRDIGAGLVTTWTPVSGVEAPLTLYVPIDGTSTSDYPNDLTPVRHPVLESMHERARALPTEGAILEAIRTDEGGVTAISGAFVGGMEGVRTIPLRNGPAAHAPTPEAVRSGAYPLMRRFFAYVRPDAMRDNAFVQRFVAFLQTDAAREAVVASGFYSPDIRGRAGEQTQVAGACIFGTLEAAAVAAATTGASRVGEPMRFDGNSLTLDAASQARIRELAASVAAQLENGATAVLIGHADTSGDADENRALALRRAIAAREAFEQAGVFGIVAESAGEQCFNRENASEDGRRANQRVELWIRPAS